MDKNSWKQQVRRAALIGVASSAGSFSCASALADAVASASSRVTGLSISGNFTYFGSHASATFADAVFDGHAASHTQDIASAALGSDTLQAVTLLPEPPENTFGFLAHPAINAARADAQSLPGPIAQTVAEAGALFQMGASASGGYVETMGIRMNSDGPLAFSLAGDFILDAFSDHSGEVAYASLSNSLRIVEVEVVGQLPGLPDYRLGFPSDLPFVGSNSQTFSCMAQVTRCFRSETLDNSWTAPQLLGGRSYVVQFQSTTTAVVAIPEPETYALMLGGLAMLAIASRGSRRKLSTP